MAKPQEDPRKNAAIDPQDNTAEPKPDAATEIPLFTNENVDGLTFGHYQKRHITAATRIRGPFRVRTPEGEVECPDGWLALDSGGYPYPINAGEFERIYEQANEVASIRNEPPAPDFWEINNARMSFASAILQNPNLERLVYGDPFAKRTVADCASVGEYLARACQRIAIDYVRASHAIEEEMKAAHAEQVAAGLAPTPE